MQNDLTLEEWVDIGKIKNELMPQNPLLGGA